MAGRLDTVFRTWDRAGRGWLDTTQFNMICADLGIEQVSFTPALHCTGLGNSPSNCGNVVPMAASFLCFIDFVLLQFS